MDAHFSREPSDLAGGPANAAVFGVGAVLIAAVSFWLLAPLAALMSCAFGAAMLAIAISDARRFIVPDVLSLPAIPAGLLVTMLLTGGDPIPAAVGEHLAAALAGTGTLLAIRHGYWWLRGREGLGLGDVKLAAVAGAWTGFAGLAPILLLACLTAIASVMVMQLRDRDAISGASLVPLGAFIAPAIWLVWFAQTSGLDLGAVPL